AHHLGQLVFQQVGRRPEQLDLVSNRAEQAAQRLTHGLVVVDNEYDRLLSGRDRSVHGNYKVRATWLIVPSYTHWARRSMVSRMSWHHIALRASYLSLGEPYLGMSLRRRRCQSERSSSLLPIRFFFWNQRSAPALETDPQQPKYYGLG